MVLAVAYSLFGDNTEQYHAALCRKWREVKETIPPGLLRGIVYHDDDLSPLWRQMCAEAGLELRDASHLKLTGFNRAMWRFLAIGEFDVVMMDDADEGFVEQLTTPTILKIEALAGGPPLVLSKKPDWEHSGRLSKVDACSVFANCTGLFDDFAAEIAGWDDPHRKYNAGHPRGIDYCTDERWLEERVLPKTGGCKHVNICGDYSVLEGTAADLAKMVWMVSVHPKRVRILVKGPADLAALRKLYRRTFAEVVPWSEAERARHAHKTRLGDDV